MYPNVRQIHDVILWLLLSFLGLPKVIKIIHMISGTLERIIIIESYFWVWLKVYPTIYVDRGVSYGYATKLVGGGDPKICDDFKIDSHP